MLKCQNPQIWLQFQISDRQQIIETFLALVSDKEDYKNDPTKFQLIILDIANDDRIQITCKDYSEKLDNIERGPLK